jgi:hypothetical protein
LSSARTERPLAESAWILVFTLGREISMKAGMSIRRLTYQEGKLRCGLRAFIQPMGRSVTVRAVPTHY